MIESIKVDSSVIPFMTAKYHLGQKVLAGDCKQVGYVIGLQRERYNWSYLVVEGENLNNDSDETWYREDEVSLAQEPVAV